MSENEKLTEEKILKLQTIVFEEEGLSGARMQSIADRAGINKALLHYYSEQKITFFEAVFTKLGKENVHEIQSILKNHLSLEEKNKIFFLKSISASCSKIQNSLGFILNEINHNPQRIQKPY